MLPFIPQNTAFCFMLTLCSKWPEKWREKLPSNQMQMNLSFVKLLSNCMSSCLANDGVDDNCRCSTFVDWRIRMGNPLSISSKNYEKRPCCRTKDGRIVLAFPNQVVISLFLNNVVCRGRDNHCKFVFVCSLICFNRQERTQAQQLRDEQDEAYYESVRADQEKVSLLCWSYEYFFLAL